MPFGLKSLRPSPVRGAISKAPKSGVGGSEVSVERDAACSLGIGGGPSSRISKNDGELICFGTRMLKIMSANENDVALLVCYLSAILIYPEG